VVRVEFRDRLFTHKGKEKVEVSFSLGIIFSFHSLVTATTTQQENNINKVRIASHAAEKALTRCLSISHPQLTTTRYVFDLSHLTRNARKRKHTRKRDFNIIIQYSRHEVEVIHVSLAIPYFIFVILVLIPKKD
jgi:hypothetical protein